MMKGGGYNKRDRRFLTIDSLSLKNEYCSDNIVEMTAVLEVLRSSMDGQYETICRPGAERVGTGRIIK